MTHTIQSLRSRIDRRMAILASLLAGLLGTGVMTLAVVNDTVTVTNNFQTLTMDLEASSDGTVFTQNVTLAWALDGTTRINKALHLKNTGNGQARIQVPYMNGATFVPGDISWTSTAGGDSAILNAAFNIYEVASAAACPQLGAITGTEVTHPTNAKVSASSQASFGMTNRTITVDPGATKVLCFSVTPSAAPTSSATQTLTINAKAGF